MSLEDARDLSIPELLHALSGKLDLETSRLRESYLLPITAIASLIAEVSTPPTYLPQRTQSGSSNTEPSRSGTSKPEHAMF